MERFQERGRALGSDIVFTIVTARGDVSALEAFKELWAMTLAFERRFSRFLPESELSLVNAFAGSRTEISPEFFALADEAQRFKHLTDGLYDPSLLPALQRAGYVGSWPDVEAPQATTDYSLRSGQAGYKLGENWIQLAPDTALDFGGIGKGFLLDRLANALGAAYHGYCLSLGGDILCSGHDLGGEDWSVGIAAADAAGSVLEEVRNRGSRRLAIATSGTTKRRGIRKGKEWHHLIDPRTRLPSNTDVLTATACASTAVLADVAAKCLVLSGSGSVRRLAAGWGVECAVVQSKSRVVRYHAKEAAV